MTDMLLKMTMFDVWTDSNDILKYLVLNRMTDMLLKMTMFDVWTDSNDILRIFFPCIKGRTTTVFTLKFSPV